MLEEQLLVAQAQRGEQSAFAQLVDQYQTPVYNLAYRMLGDANDAEDAAQEAFLRAYTQLKRFDADQKFATWLLSIAAHHCIDRLRRRRFLWLSMDEPAVGETLVSDTPEPDDEALRHESEQEIARLLERLSPANRLVVVLKYWHEQSVEEIARTTGDSVGAVKVKLHRARKALAREMTAQSKAEGKRRKDESASSSLILHPLNRRFVMQNEPRFTLVSPSAGFTTRTMTRIAEHEHAQARRRAWIGSALLVVVASALLLFVGARLASWVSALVNYPDAIESLASALAPVLFWLTAFIGALWVAVATLAWNTSELAMLAYALFVLALTMAWLRAATGSFQLFSSQSIVGGLGK